tara:strand:+ start:56 stop:238 length:183 start_codon:yes stop_codon:yes gene_type:complete
MKSQLLIQPVKIFALRRQQSHLIGYLVILFAYLFRELLSVLPQFVAVQLREKLIFPLPEL